MDPRANKNNRKRPPNAHVYCTYKIFISFQMQQSVHLDQCQDVGLFIYFFSVKNELELKEEVHFGDSNTVMASRKIKK